jgi:hypothetical protein
VSLTTVAEPILESGGQAAGPWAMSSAFDARHCSGTLVSITPPGGRWTTIVAAACGLRFGSSGFWNSKLATSPVGAPGTVVV